MLGDITINEASLLEADSILSLWKLFMEYLSQQEPETFSLKEDYIDQYRKRLPNLIKETNTLVLLAKAKEKPVGYHVTSIRYPLPILKQKPFGQISDHYVKESYRGNAIGRLLFKKSICWLMDNGIEELYLKTFLRNKKGLDFWEKQGFSPLEVILKKKL